MNLRKGLQSFPNAISLSKVFYLPNHMLMICDYDNFFIWHSKDKKTLNKVEIPYKAVQRVEDNTDIFMFSNIIEYPEYNDYKVFQTLFYRGDKILCEMPYELACPVLLSGTTIAAIYESKNIIEFDLSAYKMRPLIKANTDILFFKKLKNNQFMIIDKAGTFFMYELKNNTFVEINKKEGFANVLTIQELDEDHFVFSFPASGNKSKLQILDKCSFACTKEMEINEIIDRIDVLSDQFTAVAHNQKNSSKTLYLINFNNQTAHPIPMEDRVVDFSIGNESEMAVLMVDILIENNRLIEVSLKQLCEEAFHNKTKAATSTTTDAKTINASASHQKTTSPTASKKKTEGSATEYNSQKATSRSVKNQKTGSPKMFSTSGNMNEAVSVEHSQSIRTKNPSK